MYSEEMGRRLKSVNKGKKRREKRSKILFSPSENGFLKNVLKGVDEEKLILGEEKEMGKFRRNLVLYMRGLFKSSGIQKQRKIQAVKEGAFALLAQIPVITPIITAVLQVIFSEDTSGKIDGLGKSLGEKIDGLGKSLGEKMDTMLSLQRETLSLQKETISLQKETIRILKESLGEKMDTMLSLQRETLSLQKETISLQKETIRILEERLPKPEPEKQK